MYRVSWLSEGQSLRGWIGHILNCQKCWIYQENWPLFCKNWAKLDTAIKFLRHIIFSFYSLNAIKYLQIGTETCLQPVFYIMSKGKLLSLSSMLIWVLEENNIFVHMLGNKISPSFIEKQENVFWRLKELENSNIEFLNNQIKTFSR